MALTTQAYIPLEQIYGTSPLDIKRINDNFWYIAKKIQGFIGENDLDSAFVESLRAGSITVNTLYATYGDIAELTVDQLVTADKVQRYKDSDTSDLNYISIIGQEIKLITGSTDGSTEQHVNRYNEPLYWTDDTLVNMDTVVTAYPVTVYAYTTAVKASLSFYNDDGIYIPRLVMGAGTGTADNDKLIVYKPMDKAVFEYYTDAGVRMAHEMDADGHHFIGNVSGLVSGSVRLFVQPTQPENPQVGDVWVNANTSANEEWVAASDIKVYTGAPVGPDEYTKILLHFDGEDASTTFTDETGRSWTAYGNAQLDTAQYKLGTASGLFDGSGDYIETPDSDDLYVGSDDFTVDFWFKRNAINTTQVIFSQSDGGGNAGSLSIQLQFVSNNIFYGMLAYGSSLKYVTSPSAITDTNWHHLAFVRYGNVLSLYIDGTSVDTEDVTGITANNSTYKLSIGRQGERNENYFSGWIDELRFSKGIARWTANFTPPTEPY